MIVLVKVQFSYTTQTESKYKFTIDGTKSVNHLSGGDGNDELTSGKDADLFQCGAGIDKITDFRLQRAIRRAATVNSSNNK